MKSPAFQFYPTDFLADENVVLMTNQEVGCYIKLVCYCWREGSIPADVNRIARLCGEDGSAMAQLWTAIRLCFEKSASDPSRLVHPRLEIERQKQESFKQERSESGAKGAKARWDKRSDDQPPAENSDSIANGSANGSAMQQLMANDGSSVFCLQSSLKKEEEQLPPGLTENERFILKELSSVRGYPFDFTTDIAMIRQFYVRHPRVDLLAVVRKWALDKLGKEIPKKARPRVEIGNWCKNAEKWGKDLLPVDRPAPKLNPAWSDEGLMRQ